MLSSLWREKRISYCVSTHLLVIQCIILCSRNKYVKYYTISSKSQVFYFRKWQWKSFLVVSFKFDEFINWYQNYIYLYNPCTYVLHQRLVVHFIIYNSFTYKFHVAHCTISYSAKNETSIYSRWMKFRHKVVQYWIIKVVLHIFKFHSTKLHSWLITNCWSNSVLSALAIFDV